VTRAGRGVGSRAVESRGRARQRHVRVYHCLPLPAKLVVVASTWLSCI
jgi:hypothetical protein